MKTHIFLTILTAFMAMACASHEGREVASDKTTYENQTEQVYYHDGNTSRDIGRQ